MSNLDDIFESKGTEPTPLAVPKEDEKAIKAAVTSSMNLVKGAKQILPPVRIVTVGPDVQVMYTRETEPKCKLCNHSLRDKAEDFYISSNYVVSQVWRWLKEESGENWTWEQIANHMSKHCDFKDPMINFISKLNSRKEEIDIVMADPLEFFMKSIAITFLELGEWDTRKDVNRAKSLAETKFRAAAEFAKLFDMRNKYFGPTEQAEAMVAKNNAKLRGLMEAVMQVVTPEQKERILAIANERSQQEE